MSWTQAEFFRGVVKLFDSIRIMVQKGLPKWIEIRTAKPKVQMSMPAFRMLARQFCQGGSLASKIQHRL